MENVLSTYKNNDETILIAILEGISNIPIVENDD